MHILNRYFKVIILIVSMIGLFTRAIIAQPQIMWQQNVRGMQYAYLYDIFHSRNGELFACGHTFTGAPGHFSRIIAVCMSDEGEVLWVNYYGETSVIGAGTIIQTDDNNILMGARAHLNERRNQFIVIKTDFDGEIVWYNSYSNDFNTGTCTSIIETKGGSYLAAGVVDRKAIIVKLDTDGNVIWSVDWSENLSNSGFSNIREYEGCYYLSGHYSYDSWLVKIDDDGEVLWDHVYEFIDNENRRLESGVGAFITVPTGFILGGGVGNGQYVPDYYNRFISVDHDGGVIFDNAFPIRAETSGGPNSVIHSFGNLIGFGSFTEPDGINSRARIMKISYQGDLLWSFIDQRYSEFRSAVTDDNGYIYVAGISGMNGLIAKLIPDQSPPRIIHHHPGELHLTVLQSDSVEFFVRVVDLQDDDLTFTWTVDDEQYSYDSLVVIDFSELGIYEVKCVVSDGELSDSIIWTVEVVDFFIALHSPETLSINIRRGTSIDFAIETRSIGDEPVSYEWTLQELPLGQAETVSEEMQYSHQFNLTREYIVTAYAWRDEAIDSRAWNVSVKSVIYDYWPESSEVSIDTGRIVRFGVEPFDPEAEGLETTWYLEDELLSHELEVDLSFPAEGLYDVTVIARDGEDADTVSWEVQVNVPVSVSDENITVKQFVLHSAHPNPFNRQTTLRFDLPRQDMVKLAIYDTQGRLVKTLLNNDYRSAGNYVVEWDASGYSAGVYLIKLETGAGYRSVGKVVLVP